MPNSGSLFPLSLTPLLPPPLRRVAAPLESRLERWVIPDNLLETVRLAEQSGRDAQFANRLLELFEIRFTVAPHDLAQIPANGAALVVANHPRGIVEGLILTVLLNSVRPDYKLIANSLLSKIDAMGEHAFLVNPFRTTAANIENRATLRRCIQWLAGRGLLAMFPAGEVAHLNWPEHSVTEPAWNTAAARLALRARTTVIPVFFEGYNSLPFHLAGTLHPGLRTIGLPREFMKMRGKTVQVRIGRPVSWDLLSQYRTAASATEYLRSHTLFLANRPWSATPGPQPVTPKKQTPVARPEGSVRLLAAEVAALPLGAELARSDEFSVFAARAKEIPHVLAEIGRRREEAFGEVGAGTGKATDLDW
jgi:putative hemolysin